MILHGSIDDKNQLWIQIEVTGTRGRKESILAKIDTAFDGELALPIEIAVPLGLELAAVATYRLGDGSTVSGQLVFSADISWGTKTRPVTVSIKSSGDALIGGGLLHGYVLQADFQTKQLTIKEPGTDEPKIDDSGKLGQKNPE